MKPHVFFWPSWAFCSTSTGLFCFSSSGSAQLWMSLASLVTSAPEDPPKPSWYQLQTCENPAIQKEYEKQISIIFIKHCHKPKCTVVPLSLYESLHSYRCFWGTFNQTAAGSQYEVEKTLWNQWLPAIVWLPTFFKKEFWIKQHLWANDDRIFYLVFVLTSNSSIYILL